MSPDPPRVLYAEDNRLLMRQVTDVLELLGCCVEHYADGVLAVSALRSAEGRRAHYDLLLLDNELPALRGLEIAREARQTARWRQTPIILLALEDCTEAALEAGVDELLRKPNNLLTLADVVRRLLSASRGREKKTRRGRVTAEGKRA